MKRPPDYNPYWSQHPRRKRPPGFNPPWLWLFEPGNEHLLRAHARSMTPAQSDDFVRQMAADHNEYVRKLFADIDASAAKLRADIEAANRKLRGRHGQPQS